MALRDEILKLQNRAITDLIAAHDYFSDSQYAWGIARKFIEDGNAFSKVNDVTLTKTSSEIFIGKAGNYIARELAEATFLQFISIFEGFYFDFLQAWLIAYPRSLEKKLIDFKTILDLNDSDLIIQHVVNENVNKILYDRPAGWFEYLEEVAKLGCPTPDEVGRIAEAKATRDVIIHNRGITNKIYLAKSGSVARHKNSERIEVTERYHLTSFELFRKVIEDICNAGLKKTA